MECERLLLGCTKHVQRLADDAGQRIEASQRRAQDAYLLQRHDFVGPTQAAPPIFGWKPQAKQVVLGG